MRSNVEEVGAFFKSQDGRKLDDGHIREWVGTKLTRHKTPKHTFWLGGKHMGDISPLTGNANVKRNER